MDPSRQAATLSPGITFPVDDVEPVLTPIYSESLHTSLRRRLKGYPFHRELEMVPGQERLVANTAASSLTDEQRQRIGMENLASNCHPLIDSVHTAFSQHRPLLLSPDSIWLVLAQGFAHHIV